MSTGGFRLLGTKETRRSDRLFGLLFTGVFLVVGLLPLLSGGRVRVIALVVAPALLLFALLLPTLLHPFNLVWMKFGLLLHHIVSPIVLAAIFFLVFTPTAVVLRLLRKRVIDLRVRTEATSYWVARDEPRPDTMHHPY